jgi:hypothetical protein
LEPATNNQSFLLRQEADTLHEVTKAEVDTFLSLVPLALVPVPVVVTSSLDFHGHEIT